MPTCKGVCLAISMAVVGFQDVAVAQNLRELARQQAIRNPGIPLEQPAPPADYQPKTIAELAKEADVVLRGKLSRTNSYLSSTEDRILSDYRILEPNIIAGRPGSGPARLPGPGVPLILTVYGGEAIIEGVLVRGIDNNREAIKEGGHYLLFLRGSRQREAGRYEIHYGGIFEVMHDEVKPLLRGADDVFGDVDRRVKDMISQIQAAVKVR